MCHYAVVLLEIGLRMGTAYFAWFFEGVYQCVKKEGLYKV